MGGGAADQRETRVEMASLPIPYELLVETFLRIPDPADLVRTSAACVSFRRLIADRAFLRWYRKLHAPPLLGFLEYDRKAFCPVVLPHPFAPAASAAALAADFSFSFLPAPASDWRVQDARDGRVLLDRAPQHDINNRYKLVFPELVVCDPLHRRYLLLPPIPDDLAASVEDPLWRKMHRCCEAFLAPPGDDEGEALEETSFRVVWMGQCETKLVAFVFSSSTGQWRAIPSQSWSDLFPGLLSWTGLILFLRQYENGCFYWVAGWMEKLLVLDTRRMEFSIAEFPTEVKDLCGVAIAIVEAGEGRPGMFLRAEHTNCVNYTIRRTNCGSSSDWQLHKIISLDSRLLFLRSTGRHLYLYQCQRPPVEAGCFVLDVKTFQLERVFVSNSSTLIDYAYNNFPPSLCTPTISSGFGNKAEKEMLEQGGAESLRAESPCSE